jgi:signal transduction histidine kinase
MDQTIVAALIGVAFGTAAPWPLKAAWRLLRGEAVRNAARDTAEAKAAQAELERLLAEIARLAERNGDLEDLVDLLRRQLDRALTRGNAALTIARILLFAVDQEPKPSRAMIAAREQARQVIAGADAQMNREG